MRVAETNLSQMPPISITIYRRRNLFVASANYDRRSEERTDSSCCGAKALVTLALPAGDLQRA